MVSGVATARDELEFEVALIPHPLKITGLSVEKEGCLVNVETAVTAKYVERLVR